MSYQLQAERIDHVILEKNQSRARLEDPAAGVMHFAW